MSSASNVTKVEYYEFLASPATATIRSSRPPTAVWAMQYHPDRKPSPEAEDKFKTASEASQVLSDPQKRAASIATGTRARRRGLVGLRGIC